MRSIYYACLMTGEIIGTTSAENENHARYKLLRDMSIDNQELWRRHHLRIAVPVTWVHPEIVKERR